MTSIERSLNIAEDKMKKFGIDSNSDLDLINKFVIDRKEGKLFENTAIKRKAYSFVYGDKEYSPTHYEEQLREDILSAFNRLTNFGLVSKNNISELNALLSGPPVTPDEVVLRSGKRIRPF
jgi:hypothetical protein